MMNDQTYAALADELGNIAAARGMDKEAFITQMYGAGKALATGAKGLFGGGGKTMGQLGHRMGQAYRGGVQRMGRATGKGGSWASRQRAGLGAMTGKGGVRGAAREQTRLAKMTPEARAMQGWAQQGTKATGGAGEAVKAVRARDVALGTGIVGGTGLIGYGGMKAMGGGGRQRR